MTLPCVIDFTVDGVVVDPQPVDLRLVTAEPRLHRTPGGYALAVKRPGGRRVVVQWGDVLLPLGSALVVRGLFPDDDPTHVISWEEPTGEQISMNVAAESVATRWTQATPGFVEPLILTLKERP